MRKIPDALAPSALATALLLCPTGHAAASQDMTASTGALKRLSIEELMDIEVTSVSRAAETLSSARGRDQRRDQRGHPPLGRDDDSRGAAAAFQACTSRGVNSNTWAVSSRGVQQRQHRQAARADRRAQRLHAALLRRASGTCRTTCCEDVERIEVIRGPGASAVGRERGQRRDQHHHQGARATRRARCHRDGRHGRAGSAARALRRQARRTASFACSASTSTATRRSIRARRRRTTGASAMRAFAPTGTRAAATR